MWAFKVGGWNFDEVVFGGEYGTIHQMPFEKVITQALSPLYSILIPKLLLL